MAILNAGLADEDALEASLRVKMLELLAQLRERHGDHPALLETIADYSDDPVERAALYQQAVDISVANELPTLSIRQSFASLLTDLSKPFAALAGLEACGSEAAGGTEEDRRAWGQSLREVATLSTEEDEQQIPLCLRAMKIAESFGQSTLSIRLSLVRSLLEIGEPGSALKELRACENDLPEADAGGRASWAEMLEEARASASGEGPNPLA